MAVYDVDAAPNSQFLRNTGSGPTSGIVGHSLFRGYSGPGHWIHDDAMSVEIHFADLSPVSCRVIRLSPTALWFEPNPEVNYPLREPVQVSLRCNERDIGPMWGRIEPMDTLDVAPLLGFSFIALPLSVARQLVALLRDLVQCGAAELARRAPPVREQTSDPNRLHAIMKALSGVGNSGSITVFEAELPLSIDHIDEEGLVHWCGTIDWGPGPYVVDMNGYNSLYRVHLPEMRVQDGHVVTSLPTRIERLRYRSYRRIKVQSPVQVAFRNPLWPRLGMIRRDVHDLSFGGIAFDTALDDDLLFPGLVLPRMEVRDNNGDVVYLNGEVRGVSSTRNEAGVSITPCSPRDEHKWNRLVAQTLYPTTESGERWSEPVWELFRSSGYFDLSGKTPEEFLRLKNSFVNVEQKGASAPGLFCHAVYPSSRGIEATLSLAKAYEGTWWGHQLAKRAGAPPEALDSRQILRDIYLRAMEHPQADPHFRWMYGLIEAKVDWMRRSHIEFAQRHQPTGESLVLPFRLMECSCDDIDEPALGLQVGELRYSEMGPLCDSIAVRRPRAYIEALDLVPDRLSLSRLSRRWRNAGLERERGILVARRAGEAVAAIILETGETGASLFRLFDNVRLFSLVEGGEEAFSTLLHAARQWYVERGKQSFCYLCEHEDQGHLEEARLRDLGHGNLWIIAADLLPEFLEHVFELTPSRRFT